MLLPIPQSAGSERREGPHEVWRRVLGLGFALQELVIISQTGKTEFLTKTQGSYLEMMIFILIY